MTAIQTNHDIDFLVLDLKETKAQIKRLQAIEEKLKTQLHTFMMDHEQLINGDGEILLTWEYTANVKYFDEKKLKTDNPELYNAYIAFRDGHRRLIFK